jgi:hypothetical protein
MANNVVVRVARKSVVFDFLYKLPIPSAIASAIEKGTKAFLTIVVTAFVLGVINGSIFVDFLAPNQVPLVVAVLTPIVLGIEDWLRKHGLIEEQRALARRTNQANTRPTSSAIPGPAEGEELADIALDIPEE